MTLRLRSDITAGAIRKGASAHGAFVTVLRHGHDEAGILHIVWRQAGKVSVWSEATAPDGTRGWRCRGDGVSDADADALLEKEARFDPDLWIIEIDGDCPKESLPGEFFPLETK